MTIKETFDYDQFKEINSNREVDEHHVKRLMKAIQKTNMLHLNPIIVNNELAVVDGQHRLEAAKRLGVSVFYVKDNKIGKAQIAELNTNKMSWQAVDYLNFYCVEGYETYLRLAHLHNKWPFVPISTLSQLVSSRTQFGGAFKEFKEGKLNMEAEETGISVLTFADRVRNLGYEFAYDRNFLMAVLRAIRCEDFDTEYFFNKLMDNRMGLVKVVDTKQYLQVLEAIYNRSLRNPIRIK